MTLDFRGTPVAVIGLDLSLTSTGICVLPPHWSPIAGDRWTNMTHGVVGGGLSGEITAQQRVIRLDTIAAEIAQYVLAASPGEPVRVFVEDYAWKMGGKNGIRLGELGGAVKLALLREFGIVVEPVNISRHRGLLLGSAGNKKGVKQEVFRRLLADGARFAPNAKKKRESDTADSFCVANYGRSELDLPAMTLVG